MTIHVAYKSFMMLLMKIITKYLLKHIVNIYTLYIIKVEFKATETVQKTFSNKYIKNTVKSNKIVRKSNETSRKT